MEIYRFKAVSKRNGERIMSSSNSIAGKYKWNWKKVDYSAYLFILPVNSILLDLINLLKSHAARLKLLCVILLYAPSIDFLQKEKNVKVNNNNDQFVYSRATSQFGLNGRYVFARATFHLF